ncbi:MAG: DeoR/GlpR family DNA-binding transcription regulator [Spirochaetales bacterium]|nr:DeoR/GlpR family DNA-binding transcription regulator [Spirochaetales bacterium]
MIPYMRRKKILELLHTKEFVYLDELVEYTGVSLATVRRDLKLFEEEGQVEFLQGGAAKIKVDVAERNVKEKLVINQDMKEIAAGYAATLVNDGQFIYIGPGTTEHWMFQGLGGKDVTVVTNGALHIDTIIENKINAKFLGGDLLNDISVVVGYDAIKQIEKMNFDKCFIGVSGFTIDRGASTSQYGVAEINKLAISRSKKSYLLLDSTKVGKNSKYTFASPEVFDSIIIAGPVSSEYLELDNLYPVEMV